jgi:hypothetical protein
VRLYDPLEMELPDLGMLVVQDAETGEQIFVDTHDRGFRRRFEAAAKEREAELHSAFGNAGVDALELSTNDDLVDAILRFADMRKRRSQLAVGGGPSPTSWTSGMSAARAAQGAHCSLSREGAQRQGAPMTWLWPESACGLLLLVRRSSRSISFLLRRKKKTALRYASLSIMRDALGTGHRVRRHLPPALFLVAPNLDDPSRSPRPAAWW